MCIVCNFVTVISKWWSYEHICAYFLGKIQICSLKKTMTTPLFLKVYKPNHFYGPSICEHTQTWSRVIETKICDTLVNVVWNNSQFFQRLHSDEILTCPRIIQHSPQILQSIPVLCRNSKLWWLWCTYQILKWTFEIWSRSCSSLKSWKCFLCTDMDIHIFLCFVFCQSFDCKVWLLLCFCLCLYRYCLCWYQTEKCSQLPP